MYYLDKNIMLASGIRQEEYNIHIITYLSIDYLNREMVAYVTSFKNMSDLAKSFINKDSTVICASSSFSLKYEMETFNIDPVLVALRILTLSDKDSAFHKAEIKRIYSDSKILNDLLPLDTHLTDNQSDLKHLENWQNGNYETYVNYSNELTDKDFAISDVLIGNVVEK